MEDGRVEKRVRMVVPRPVGFSVTMVSVWMGGFEINCGGE